jgi:hypothetical protein
MKKLTDVYIKVTKDNANELRILLKLPKYNFDIDTKIVFLYEDLNSWQIRFNEVLGDRKKVSLTELKRLIGTIPTREEIKRLKQQISAYKMNYDKVVKRCEELEIGKCRLNRSHFDYIVKANQIVNDLQNQKKVTDEIIHNNNSKIKQLESMVETCRFDLKRIKQRKWWQIWK